MAILRSVLNFQSILVAACLKNEMDLAITAGAQISVSLCVILLYLHEITQVNLRQTP